MDPLAIALIDESRCIGCALCLPACPVDAISGAAGHMHTVIARHCTGCELCIPACPVDCIAMVAGVRNATGELGGAGCRRKARAPMRGDASKRTDDAPPRRRSRPRSVVSSGRPASRRGVRGTTRDSSRDRLNKRPPSYCVALVPGATIQAATFGDGVLANVAIAAMTAVAAETFIAKLRGIAPIDVMRDGSGIVTAALLALALPPAVPFGIVIVGVLIAIGIGKHAFGGAGANPFNPAMVGYAALLLSFPAALAIWPDTTGTAVDGVTGPTVLDAFKHRGGLTVADFWTPARGFGAFGRRRVGMAERRVSAGRRRIDRHPRRRLADPALDPRIAVAGRRDQLRRRQLVQPRLAAVPLPQRRHDVGRVLRCDRSGHFANDLTRAHLLWRADRRRRCSRSERRRRIRTASRSRCCSATPPRR